MPRSATPAEPAVKHENGNGHTTNGHGNGAKQAWLPPAAGGGEGGLEGPQHRAPIHPRRGRSV